MNTCVVLFEQEEEKEQRNTMFSIKAPASRFVDWEHHRRRAVPARPLGSIPLLSLQFTQHVSDEPNEDHVWFWEAEVTGCYNSLFRKTSLPKIHHCYHSRSLYLYWVGGGGGFRGREGRLHNAPCQPVVCHCPLEGATVLWRVSGGRGLLLDHRQEADTHEPIKVL